MTSAANIAARPWQFALVAVLIYAAAITPALLRHGFDPSAFIVAGDQFTHPSQLPSPIYVRPHSSGYDGQFYYRLALAPFDFRQPLYGVQIDTPAYRMQRIVYPVLAWAVSLAQPRLVPLALLLVNLAGITAIAVLSARLTRRLELPAIVPIAIMLWPGFLVTLTHDTTEIVSAAFVLAALDRYFAGRWLTFAILAAVAMLARETAALVFGGLFVYEALSRNLWRAVICGLTVVPFLIWRQSLTMIWHAVPSASAMDVLNWPLVGIVQAFTGILFGDYVIPTGVRGLILRGYAFVSIAFLVAFSALTASRIVGGRKVLVAAWLPLVALMSILGVNGPWVEPIGFFRAFTECWIIGCLLLDARFAQSRFAMPAGNAGRDLDRRRLACDDHDQLIQRHKAGPTGCRLEPGAAGRQNFD